MNILPELKNRETITTRAGRRAMVKKLTRRAAEKIRPEFEEPLYRIIYPAALGTRFDVIGAKVWTLDELAAAGVTA